MDVAPLIIGALIAGYGIFVLWNRSAVIPFGRVGFWKPTPFGYIRMNGLTAVIFSIGLILGGVTVAFPSGYQFLSGKPLSDDLPLWIPVVGLVIIAVGVIGAVTSSLLRAAQSFGDDIYARKQARDQENKEK